MKFSKYFAKEDVVPSSRSNAGRVVLAMILVMMLAICDAKAVKARMVKNGELTDCIRKWQAEHKEKEAEIIKSDNMTSEKSSEEFIKRFREESMKKDFDHRLFIRKVTKGLAIEIKYDKKGKRINIKQNINPNYSISIDEHSYGNGLFGVLVFDYKRFCLPSDRLINKCDDQKECNYRPWGISFMTAGDEEVSIIYDRGNTKCIWIINFRDKCDAMIQ